MFLRAQLYIEFQLRLVRVALKHGSDLWMKARGTPHLSWMRSSVSTPIFRRHPRKDSTIIHSTFLGIDSMAFIGADLRGLESKSQSEMRVGGTVIVQQGMVAKPNLIL